METEIAHFVSFRTFYNMRRVLVSCYNQLQIYGKTEHVVGKVVFNISQKYIKLEKWFPLQGERGHSSYFRCFQKQNRDEGETE